MQYSLTYSTTVLIVRVEFYESCVDQLKRDIPKYLSKHRELDKSHKQFAKTLRSVASSEPNQKLRDLMFLYSQKHELFEKEREALEACAKSTHEMLEEATKLIIVPAKVIPFRTCQELIHGSHSSTSTRQDIITDQKSILKVASTSTGSKTTPKSKSDPTDLEFMQGTLQIHCRMFEKHRLHSTRTLLKTLLSAELRYHCRVVEEISAVLQELAAVEDTV